MTSGNVTPPVNSTSVVLTIAATHNQLSVGSLRGLRELSWEYPTAEGIVVGSVSYTLDGQVPFPVSPQGVRNKLGVPTDNLDDQELDLIEGYWSFQERVGADALAVFENTDGKESYRIASAIEALVAIAILPTLAIRIAERESSGTNEFSRGKIDWQMIENSLWSIVETGRQTVTPGEGADEDYGSLFIVATGPDRLTG